MTKTSNARNRAQMLTGGKVVVSKSVHADVKRTDREKEVWIGLIEVVALKGNLLPVNCKGAYVNGLALVSGAEEYERVARKQLRENGFQVLSVEDVEKFGKRVKTFQVEKALIEMANVCENTGDFCLGTFFVWEDK